ncbi:hypothetical protein [Spirosoma sp. 48-14]|jgi:hypothetical protein|uniref:hypothetical protein n=1 Tax=Spirosoma sp. 48-14 TaxID=1895854 RepID=UPI000966817F|nr:hypothetical protein [Spirosoma sp. 48-14]OJW72948.1 MAG: hypothetical protein BGO59_09425 [Spirosoma sp. 48-14]
MEIGNSFEYGNVIELINRAYYILLKDGFVDEATAIADLSYIISRRVEPEVENPYESFGSQTIEYINRSNRLGNFINEDFTEN